MQAGCRNNQILSARRLAEMHRILIVCSQAAYSDASQAGCPHIQTHFQTPEYVLKQYDFAWDNKHVIRLKHQKCIFRQFPGT